MSKKSTQKTVQQNTLDPATQRFVDESRARLSGAAGGILDAPAGSFTLGPETRSIAELAAPFMDPYLDTVIGGVQGHYDRLRTASRLGTNEAATRAGAFGGMRHGVAEGVERGRLGEAEANQIGGLLSQGWQNAVGQGLSWADYNRQAELAQRMEPIMRAQAAGGLYNLGFGAPYGTTSTNTQEQRGSTLGALAGAGLAIGSRFIDPSGATGAAVGGLFQPSFNPTTPSYGGPLYQPAGPNALYR